MFAKIILFFRELGLCKASMNALKADGAYDLTDSTIR